MRLSLLNAAPALLSSILCLSACRSANRESAACSSVLQVAPSIAARDFFTNHYDFYYEDPARCEALLTPRLFQALKHHYDAFERTHEIGALDCDPWTNAQDGEISKPYKFTTLNVGGSEAVVQFNYTFALSPEKRVTQSVWLKFQRPSLDSGWLLSDLIMPDKASLVKLLERRL